MQFKNKGYTRLKIISCILGGCFSVIGSYGYFKNSQSLMPKEYKSIKTIVNQLATTNNLGINPITFTITTGSTTSWLAEELGLCKEDKCSFYRFINPFISYKGKSQKDINEAIRQTYLTNTIEASAWSNGLINISRSTFKTYNTNNDLLACTIGHELSHFLNNDIFKGSLKEGRVGKFLDDKNRKILSYSISREIETSADINATKMIINSGLQGETCLRNLSFVYFMEGDGEETTKESTHLGYEDRYAALKEFLDEYDSKTEAKKIEMTKGNWEYNRKLNTLTFTPI
tara:strand:+ start:4129 stop:4989 length:861 start_codon:yes stop_codon:yes gene_type:complete